MMSSPQSTTIKQFSFFGNEVRVVDRDGNPWFVLADIAKVLGIANTRDLAKRVRENQRSRFNLGRQGEAIIINESGLYRMLLRSDKAEAEPFQIWVEDEVLPTIRKHGIYAAPATIESMLANPDFAISLLQNLKNERELRERAEEERNRLLHSGKTYTATELAKECGLRSAAALNLMLVEKKIQYQQNKTWVLYSKFADRGYTEIKQITLDSGKIVYDRRFTDTGRDFILSLFDAGME
jgi:prophage antirepressor-like protein